MVDPELSANDEMFLKNWFAAYANLQREDIDDPSKRGHYDYHEFMGDHAKPPLRPHNRRMLAFIAGMPKGNAEADPKVAVDDRQRLIAIQAWQLSDHMDNTDREKANERRQHRELSIVLAIPAITFFLLAADAFVQEDVGGVIAYMLSAVLFVFATLSEGLKWAGRPGTG